MVQSVQPVLRIMANWWCLASILMSVDMCLTYHITDNINPENTSKGTDVEVEVTDIPRVSLQVTDVSSVPQSPHHELLPQQSSSLKSIKPNQTPDGVMIPQSTPPQGDTSSEQSNKNTTHITPMGGLQNSSLSSIETHVLTKLGDTSDITTGQKDSPHLTSVIPGFADSPTVVKEDIQTKDEEPPLGIARVQTVQQGGLIIDPIAQPCTEEVSFQLTAHIFLCPNAASFYKFALERSGGEPVAVRVARVDGGLSLAPLADVALVSLFLQDSNLTHFSNENPHQQETISPLTKLDLSGNPDLDAATLTSLGILSFLSYLQLRGTALTTLGSHLVSLMKHLPRLQHLDLSYTRLQDLPLNTFHLNQELKYLNIAGNELHQVTLDKDLVQQLTHLNMSWCGLREMKVQALSTNNTTLPEHSQVPSLHTLDVSHNLLTFLPVSLIDALTSGYSHVVITMFLSHHMLLLADNSWHEACMQCSLYHLWHYTTTVAPNSVVGGENLHCFKMEALRSCSWEECPLGCHCNRSNKTVNCSDAGLETIPIVGPADAETLILANNRLSNMTGIDSPVWCNLKILSLEYNQLKILVTPRMIGQCHCHEDKDYYSAEQDCFPQQLQMLNLNHNNLKGILSTDCPVLYPLQEIHLAWNMVQTLGAQACGSLQQLQVLMLGHNNITNMEESDFATYPNLQQLYISHNSLMTLQPRITELMPKLRILDVSNNCLEKFSDNLSSPHSPFSSMESSPLEELYFNNNKFSQIEPIFDLKHISSLEKLTLDNNLWSCHCSDLSKLKGRVWKELRNQVLIKAVQTMKCHLPRNLRNTDINADTVTKVCHETSVESVFMSLVACLIIAVICFVICYSMLKKRLMLGLFGRPAVPDERDDTVGSRYDVFVVHSLRDYEVVHQNVIIPLTHRGYSVAWHDNVFRPGDWILENVERAVRNSWRMLVVATDNLMSCRLSQQVIRRGRNEEFNRPGFKVLALVMETLPRGLTKDLFEIVAHRTHVLFNNRDYIERICNFLPAPTPQETRPDGVYLTETDIRTLLQRFEEIRQRDRRQQVPLSEVFSMQRESNHVTINVDIASTLECNGGITLPPLSEEDCRLMVHRFKTRPPPTDSISQPASLRYFLIDHDNEEEEEEVVQMEGFKRCSFNRISCKF